MGRSGLVLSVARWSATNRWKAVGAWLALVVLCVVIGGAVGTKENDNSDYGPGESGRAGKAIDQADFSADKPKEQVIIQPRGGGELTQATADEVVADLRERFQGLSGIENIADPVRSDDGRSQLVEVGLTPNEDDDDEANEADVGAMLAATKKVQAEHPDLVVEQTGPTSMFMQFDDQLGEDFKKAELFTLPVTLGILIITFGALLAAAVPLVLALTAVAGAIGLSALASYAFPATDELSSVILLVGMAVGVDYSLFYLRREREERERGVPARSAIEIAAATSGRAVAVSGMAVIIAMSGMFLAGDSTFTSLGTGTILVVAVAVLGSLTVLPAVLSLFGNKVDRPRVPFIHRLRKPGRESRVWSAVLGRVLRRPGVALALGVAALAALALPLLSMHTRFTTIDDITRDIETVAAYDKVSSAFPSEGASHLLVIESTDGQPLDKAAVGASVNDLARKAEPSGLFAFPQEPEMTYSDNGKVVQVDLPFPYQETDKKATTSLELLRDDLVPSTVGQLDGTWSGVTGFTASDHDFTADMNKRLPFIIAFVLALTFVVLLMTFRSVVIALTSIVLNLLSVAAAYGLLVLVFQHSWAEGLLGFESNGAIVTWLPLFLFVILFGLSMDYHVFVVSRIREGHDRGMSTNDAVRHGIITSASTVTSAAFVMVGVFAIFATLSLLEFKQMGVGLAAAILIDATVVRGVLVPAAMSLLGRHNWYMPAWLNWLPHLGHRPEAVHMEAPRPQLVTTPMREM